MDEQENLWQYFFALFDRLKKQLDLPFQLTADGFASEDYPQLGALREALINLLMHSDYFSPGKARIRIFQDCLEFLNPAALPESLERIMAEALSLSRNPILTKLFRVARLAENAGYGFDKMIQGWQNYTNTTPEFEQGLNFTKAIFWLKETAVTMKPEPELEEQDWAQVRKKLEKKFGEKFGGSSEKILQMIAQDSSLSAMAMSEKLELSSRAVEKQLSKLKDMGVIERIGPAKGGFWKIKLED
jgi:ATP-dependent DNA helicase RecG